MGEERQAWPTEPCSQLGLSNRLAMVARRASPLGEWLAAARATACFESQSISAPHAADEWVRAYAAGDVEAWRRRLSWDGWTEEAVRQALAERSESPRFLEESWVRTLESALRKCPEVVSELRSGQPLAEGCRGQSSPPPFFEFWVPFVRAAQEALAKKAPDALAAVSHDAFAPMVDRLLGRLAGVSALSLYEWFSRFREVQSSFALRWLPKREDAPSHSIYAAFVLQQLADPVAFFEEFSVVARQTARILEDWVDFLAEFLGRLQTDSSMLEAEFGPLGPLRSISPELSDPHNGGRSVLGLRFASGARLIYKPRTVALEAAYNSFLAWLNERGAWPSLRCLRILARQDYGWTEAVEQTSAASRQEVEDYFRRAGMLLCVAYLLGGKDLHMDNVIAAANGPVVMDSESILQPDLVADGPAAGSRGAIERASQRIQRSFLRTGLLTFLQVDASGRVAEMGGLRGRGGHVASMRSLVWRFVNSDAMRPEYQRSIAEPMQNLLFFESQLMTPEEFAQLMIEGFDGLYRLLMDHRDEILGPTSPLAAFSATRTRMIFRSSNLYAALLADLVTPRFQRDAVLATFHIDSLNRVFRGESSRPLLWPLVAQERAALENLDIPYFLAGTDTTVLNATTGEKIHAYIARSGIEAVRARVEDLSEENLTEQVSLLRAALTRSEEPAIAPVHSGEAWPGFGPGFERDELLRLAEAIGEDVRGRAIQGDDGSLTWIAPSYLRLDERSDRGASYYLYDGVSGIALFFAALGAVTGRSEHVDAARAACRPIATVLSAPNAAALLGQENIGVCNGLGSVIYALSIAGQLAGDGGLLDLAQRCASHITPERIARDQNLDVEGGAAGAIIGLLALHRVRPDRELLEKAMTCGRHLVSAHEAVEVGGWAWRGREGAPLAGFAHGAAGIALACARLWKATGERRFRLGARQAHLYERSLFCAEAGNWPVLHSGASFRMEPPVFMTAWCHGAPGIGLARVGVRAILEDAEIDAEIGAAIATTLQTGILRVDHLCCGNLGLADMLLTCGRLLGRQELVAEARARTALVAARGMKAGAFRLRSLDSENTCFQPGFFRGLSGVGYELLRMAEPDTVPSVLLFEGVDGGS